MRLRCAFLVAGARRLIAAHEEYGQSQGKAAIPATHISISHVRDNLHGLDQNPFACALAEINLLIQVLDLIAIGRAAGLPVQIDRFHIYNTDTLALTPDTRSVIESTELAFPADQLPIEEQLKTGTGVFEGKFDYPSRQLHLPRSAAPD